MQQVIAGIGPISSGKSTSLLPVAERFGYTYISPDRIREEFSGDEMDHKHNGLVWETAFNRMHDALREGRSVIFDATQYKQEDRSTFIREVRKHENVELVGVHFDVPLTELLVRNDGRERPRPEYAIRRMFDFLRRSPPRREEGFDVLLTFEELEGYVSSKEER